MWFIDFFTQKKQALEGLLFDRNVGFLVTKHFLLQFTTLLRLKRQGGSGPGQ